MRKEISEHYELSRYKRKWLISVLVISIFYSVLRYNVFKGVLFDHFPVYILNKVISFSGLVFIALSYVFSKSRWLRFDDSTLNVQFSKYMGLLGFSLSAIHVFLSLMILNAEYYPKLFKGGMLNFKGELSMLMGVGCFFCFAVPAITTIPVMQDAMGISKWQQSQRIGYLGLLLAVLHVFVMGFAGWLKVETWPGYLPPITLLSFLVGAVPLIFKYTRNNSNPQ